MVYLKWGFWTVFWIIVVAFLHYTLPQHDVVRITDTYEKRENLGENWLFWSGPDVGSGTDTVNYDVFFIQAFRTNGKPMIYRNQDTGWGWPPYYKFNSSDLQAKAADLTSDTSRPQWVLVRHYGWRNQLLTIYPNVLDLRAVDGPDHRVIPWFNILVITGLVAILLTLRRLWRRFRKRRIDPIVRDVAEAFDPDSPDKLPARPHRGPGMKFREWWTETFG